MLKTLALLVAALTLAGSAHGATGDGVKLARVLKATMVHLYKAKAPDHAITKVTCVLAPMATTARCKAYFTITSQQAKGWYDIAATINRTTGGVQWRQTKVTCKDSVTGAPVTGC